MSKKKKQFNKKDTFVKFVPSGEDVCLAHQRAKEMGILPNSYTQGLGRMTGCLGEIAVHKYLPRSRSVGNTQFNCDLLYKNKEVEIKSKICSSEPLPTYSAFVNCSKELNLNNDVYFFTRVRKDLMVVWLVGWIPTTHLLQKATYVRRGDKDKDGFVFKAAGLHLLIESLNPVTEFR